MWMVWDTENVWNQLPFCAGKSASDALRILHFSLGIQSTVGTSLQYLFLWHLPAYVEQVTRVTGISSVPNVSAILMSQDTSKWSQYYYVLDSPVRQMIMVIILSLQILNAGCDACYWSRNITLLWAMMFSIHHSSQEVSQFSIPWLEQ